MVRNTKPPTEARIMVAVEMRRRGGTWEAVGQRLNCAAETVRRWPARYPERWQDAVRQDAERMAKEADGDLVRAMSQLLKDEKPMTRFRAAKALIEFRIRRERQKIETLIEAASPASKVAFALKLVEEFSDVELQIVATRCQQRTKQLSPAGPSAT